MIKDGGHANGDTKEKSGKHKSRLTTEKAEKNADPDTSSCMLIQARGDT